MPVAALAGWSRSILPPWDWRVTKCVASRTAGINAMAKDCTGLVIKALTPKNAPFPRRRSTRGTRTRVQRRNRPAVR